MVLGVIHKLHGQIKSSTVVQVERRRRKKEQRLNAFTLISETNCDQKSTQCVDSTLFYTQDTLFIW